MNNRHVLKLVFLLAAFATTGSVTAEVITRHYYDVTVDTKLATMQVRAELAGQHHVLSLDNPSAATLTSQLRYCDEHAPLAINNQRIELQSHESNCIHYQVSVADAPGTGRRSLSSSSNSRVVSPDTWLWLPELDEQTEIHVRFQLPEGMNVSVPWTPVTSETGHEFRFGVSPNSANAVTVFGDFTYREVQIPGATLRISILDSDIPADSDKIIHWLRAAALDVTRVYGYFPSPMPQIIVAPVAGTSSGFSSRSRSAVPFGRVVRDDGESVHFYVDQTRPLDDYLSDWTATHEFSHLLLPYVKSDQSWISEGFASYYQNILLARAGVYSEETALHKLYYGIHRAQETGGNLTPNQASRSRDWGNARMMRYWSGAAMALLADMQLRRQSDGRESLDSVLEKLQSCCLPSAHTWGGRELFEKLDALSSIPVFVELYDTYADSRGVPDLKQLSAELGIHYRRNKISLRDDAEAARHRRELLRVDSDYAAIRGG